jgi:3-oxoacyl-[acyl-carrier protein] reductase
MIVVTGASRGLGRAICERLIKKNIDVLGLARNVDVASFSLVNCDVSSYESVKEVARQLKKDGAKVTGLVNVAGIASMNLAVTTPQSVAQKIINTNLLGTIYCCQLFAPLMLRNKQGSIINFSTIAVALGLKGESIYAASKAGVEGFTRSFAREMADFNV